MNNKGKFSFARIRNVFAGAIMGAAAMWGAAAHALPGISSAYIFNSPSGGSAFYGGEEIVFYVSFDEEITVTSGSPRLVLSNLSNLANKGTVIYADYSGAVVGDPYTLAFSYTVKGGDYSSGLNASQFQLNGATIVGETGNVSDTTLENGLDDQSLGVRTFYFYGTATGTSAITVPTAYCKINRTYTRTITGGSGMASDLSFSFSLDTQDTDVEVELTFTSGSVTQTRTLVYGGSVTAQMLASDGTLQIDAKPLRETEEEITINIVPTGASSDAALRMTWPEVLGNVLTIDSIEADVPTASYGNSDVGKYIIIKVNFSDKLRASGAVSGNPFLTLNVQNRNNNSTYANNNTYADYAIYDRDNLAYSGKTMYFKYLIKAGDYVDDLDVTAFNRNGATITATTGAVVDGTTIASLPKGDNANSLASKSNVAINTMLFANYASRTPAISANGDETILLEVSRGGAVSLPQSFSITSEDINGNPMSNGEKISYPTSFNIPAYAESAAINVSTIEDGVQVLRVHPYGWTGTEGDLLATFTITGSSRPSVQLQGDGSVYEGAENLSIKVTFDKPPKADTRVTVTTSDRNSLAIQTAAGGTMSGGSAVFNFAAGSTPDYSVVLRPLDGLSAANDTITLTATATTNGVVASTYSHAIRVINVAPEASVTPVDENGEWVITGFSANSAGTLLWSATDVARDLSAGITNIIDLGDGTVVTNVCNAQGSGSVRHIYAKGAGNSEEGTGGYPILLQMIDKDGGTTSVRGRVIVDAPVKGLIREFKRDSGFGRDSYKSASTEEIMNGVGEGTILDVGGGARDSIVTNFEWMGYYDKGEGSVTFKPYPEDFTATHPGTGDPATFNSFFHVWVGEDAYTDATVTDPKLHLKSASVEIDEETKQFTVGGVFSREYYPEDGVPDIDGDQLPDDWEINVWPQEPAFESVLSPYGTKDNPDNDYLPSCVASVNPDGSFNITDGKAGNYFTPAGGIPFYNVYEVRGTHWGLNIDKTGTPSIGVTNYTAYTVETATVAQGDDPDTDAHISDATGTIGDADIDPALAAAAQDTWVLLGSDAGVDTYARWTASEAKSETLYMAQDVEPKDEPHFGTYADADGGFAFTDGGPLPAVAPFYGTDPTNPDSDGDLCTDGWEYFFWRQAKFATSSYGEKYDPTKVITGTPLDNAEVEAMFNPCVPGGHLTADVDGDGLSNFEEFLIGTNPAHWDSDGDRMNDGWEVMWGLDPFDPDDWKQNPDGDFMAADGLGNLHADVFTYYGFDPRTAWIANYHDRNRGRSFAAPNTAPFCNYQEYYVARWLIDHGFATEVPPTSREWMSQPTPAGTTRFYDPAWKGNANHVPPHQKSPGDEGSSSESAGESYELPYGDLTYLVQSQEITSHGCDTDGDGMPDGWELYLCSTDGSSLDGLWPCPTEDWKFGITGSAEWEDDFDGDKLPTLKECHSVELCDYYGSLTPNGFANANGNWYNKWWPSNPFDFDTDHDRLTDGEEGDSTFRYQDLYEASWGADGALEKGVEEQLAERFGDNTMKRGHVPGGGLNPCSVDTDMDYIPDPWEYLYAGYNRDTDWEGGFIDQDGIETSLSIDAGTVVISLAGGGMDGTYFDSRNCVDEVEGLTRNAGDKKNYVIGDDTGGYVFRDFDFDHDGLANYQEYFINGVRHFQYDKWVAGGDYGDYDIQQIYDTGDIGKIRDIPLEFKKWDDKDSPTMAPKKAADLWAYWDWARYADDWQTEGLDLPNNLQGSPMFPFSYMPIEQRPAGLGLLSYASTDPRLADSDGDNMDDYYEMFHGLNPILSDVVDYCNQGRPYGETMDVRAYPWVAGLPGADPDGDDKPNWEEALSPNQPAPANHNTDPSPLWMTDMSYDHSFVNLYYNWGTSANFWAPESLSVGDSAYSKAYRQYPVPTMMVPISGVDPRPHYVFSFESTEGFDTDNDNISDPYEINGSAGGVTDPLNPDRPIARKALYLDGNAAARTRSICAFGPNALRSFTLEAWVMPENPKSGRTQVILERPVAWKESNTDPTYSFVRRNFRLGLRGNGVPFVEYENGGKTLITEGLEAPAGYALEANRWYHVAATMDGFSMKLKLFIDGDLVASKATAAIPYTGFDDTALNPVGDQEYHKGDWAPIVIGAADANPHGKVDGSYDFDNGVAYNIAGGQPQLSNFFKGWIDEVRIWDGARPGGDDVGDQRIRYWKWPTIRDDFVSLKRYGMSETLASLNDTVKYLERVFNYRKSAIETAAGATISGNGTNTTWYYSGVGETFTEFRSKIVSYLLKTGGEDNFVRIPPMLLCAYSFDTLPDPDYEPVQPAKFATLNGRPLDYNGTPWLRGATDRTTIYTSVEAPYLFPQYIHNWVSWLPIGHLVEDGIDHGYAEIDPTKTELPLYVFRADATAHSKYWTRDAKGGHSLDSYASNSGLMGANGHATGLFNNFPNSANPYGYRYETSNYRDGEFNPVTTLQEAFDAAYASLYNDLVPLRNAKADMDIQLWDDPAGNNLGVNADTDRDGLPDYWELANGMDIDSADQNGNGVADIYDDFDNDGLNNYAEYLAGLAPFDADTDDDGIADYFDSPDGGLSYGDLYSDGDHVLDAYEQQWEETFASPYLYDEHLDRDLDGWDNWSEALVGSRLQYNTYDDPIGKVIDRVTDGETNGVGQTSYDTLVFNVTNESSVDDKASNFPMPDLTLTLDYQGDRLGSYIETGAGAGARLIIHAYTDPEMNGWPDVVFAKYLTSDIWPMTVTVRKEDVIYGHLRQGKNWFFAWVELDGTYMDPWISYPVGESQHGVNSFEVVNNKPDWPTWTSHEPAAVADYQAAGGIDIGWDYNPVTFHLSDDARGYIRFNFAESTNEVVQAYARDGLNHNVWIKHGAVGTIFEKQLKWPRVWLHEGDMQTSLMRTAFNMGQSTHYGIPVGAVEDIINHNDYFVYVQHTEKEYGIGYYGCPLSVNWFMTSLGAPTLMSPIGHGAVYSARPEFQFVLPGEATEFQMTIDKQGGGTIYSERLPAPNRTALPDQGYSYLETSPYARVLIWTPPASVVFERGATYNWTITPYNVASTGSSASGTFMTATPAQFDAKPVYGRVSAKVVYPSGWAYENSATPKVLVGAWRSASFNGEPDALVELDAASAGAASDSYGPEAKSFQTTLYGLSHNAEFHLMAWIDQNGNGVRDVWEPWGYYRMPQAAKPFMPVSVTAPLYDTGIAYEFSLSDPDTDNDLMPDAVEYLLYGSSNPDDFLAQSGTTSAQAAGLRSTASAAVSSASLAAARAYAMTHAALLESAYGDKDGDGIADLVELNYGISAFVSDSDNDGIDDGDELTLFGAYSAAKGAQTLTISGIDIDADGNVTLDWGWNNAPAGTATSSLTVGGATSSLPEGTGTATRAIRSTASSVNGLRYVIEATDSLTEPNWVEVKRIDAATGATSGGTLPESATGAMFFRVRLEK